ncbi:hypothetical protein D3C75_1071790 [compost metagenome]
MVVLIPCRETLTLSGRVREKADRVASLRGESQIPLISARSALPLRSASTMSSLPCASCSVIPCHWKTTWPLPSRSPL